jgi:hypothetical protein
MLAGLNPSASNRTRQQPLTPEVLQDCISRMQSKGTYKAWRLPAPHLANATGAAAAASQVSSTSSTLEKEQQLVLQPAASDATAGAAAAADVVALGLCYNTSTYLAEITKHLPEELQLLLSEGCGNGSSSSSSIKGAEPLAVMAAAAADFQKQMQLLDSRFGEALQQMNAATFSAAAAAAACNTSNSSSGTSSVTAEQHQQQQPRAQCSWDHVAAVCMVADVLGELDQEGPICQLLLQHLLDYLHTTLPVSALHVGVPVTGNGYLATL